LPIIALLSSGLVFLPAKVWATPLVYPIYVWADFYNIVTNPSGQQAQFLGICQSEGYNVAYLAFDGDTPALLTSGNHYYQNFITNAKSLGIKTYMAIGGTSSNFSGSSLTTDEGYISDIIQYNVSNPTKKIDGINWDIEGLSSVDYADYTSYIETLKGVTYSGETILSQGLEVSAYIDAYDTFDCITFIQQLNCVDLNTYASGMTTGGSYGTGIEGSAATGATICEAQGIPFSIGIETSSVISSEFSVYTSGYSGYESLRNAVDSYFRTNYSKYSGQYVESYDNHILQWNTP